MKILCEIGETISHPFGAIGRADLQKSSILSPHFFCHDMSRGGERSQIIQLFPPPGYLKSEKQFEFSPHFID